MALTKKLPHAQNVFGLMVMLQVQTVSKMAIEFNVNLNVNNDTWERGCFVIIPSSFK